MSSPVLSPVRHFISLAVAAIAVGCGGGSSTTSATPAAPASADAQAAAVGANATPAAEGTGSAQEQAPLLNAAAAAPAMGEAVAAAGDAQGTESVQGVALPAPLPAATAQAITGNNLPSGSTAVACRPAGLFSTFEKPFAADSPWNSRPVNPVLGTATIPTSTYYPLVSSGTYSSAAFRATAADAPMVVSGPTTKGIWDADSEAWLPTVTIAHWPAGVVPASGGDGHAEVVDTASGVVHSFWQLKQVEGKWQAAQYAWTPINGRGMGDPAHYFQGARAAGVSTLGGMIRIHEVNDGDTAYRHALAMSLTFNGLSPSPTYQFPATSADTTAASTNTGAIPMGSRMFLPASFNAQALATPELRKVAETLKLYGAYVVDRNVGTPYYIYVENGADFKLHKNGWSNATANDLQVIRAALRPLQGADSWVDGNGNPVTSTTSTDLNLLSMRGYWYRTKGTQSGVFDTWRQAVVFPATTTAIEQVNAGGRAYAGLKWGAPKVGDSYRLRAYATGGARFRMTITDTTSKAVVYDSGDMADGQALTFTWPSDSFKISTYAKSGTGGVESTVRAELINTHSSVSMTSACSM
jgi:hypothetical protein